MTTTPVRHTTVPGTGAHSSDSGCPAVVWVLLAGSLLVRAAGFAYPFLSHHVAGRGHSAQAVGAVLTAFGVGCVAGQFLVGWLCDRFGRRIPLVTALATASVALAALAAAHSLAGIMLAAAVVGVIYDAPRPVLSAVIGDLVTDPQRRAKVEVWRLGWIANVGAGIAGGLGAVLAARTGIPALILVNAAACAAFAILALLTMPADAVQTGRRPSTSYRQAFADRSLVLLLASGLATMTALMGLLSVIPMIMTGLGLDATSFGVVTLANAVAVVAVTPALSPWLVRCTAGPPRLDVLAVTGLSSAVVMGLAALAHSTAFFVLAAVACAPAEVAWFVVAAGVMHRIAPSAHRGRYHGLWGTTLAAAAVIAPGVAAVSLRLGGQPLVAVTTTAIGLAGVALCLPLGRALSTNHRSVI